MPKLFHLSCSPLADSESSAGARVFIDRFREEHGSDQTSPVWRDKILDPFRRYWELMPAHEFYLAGNDPRQLRNVRKQIDHDVLIMRGILNYLGFSPRSQKQMNLELENTEPRSELDA